MFVFVVCKLKTKKKKEEKMSSSFSFLLSSSSSSSSFPPYSDENYPTRGAVLASSIISLICCICVIVLSIVYNKIKKVCWRSILYCCISESICKSNQFINTYSHSNPQLLFLILKYNSYSHSNSQLLFLIP